MSCQEHFIKLLRASGRRLTPQRLVVLNALHDLPGYSTAEHIYELASQVDPEVDRSTVYRTLELLQSLDMVLSLDRDGDVRHFALHAGQAEHFHLVCSRCGAVTDADLALLAPLLKQLQSRHGFAVDQGQLTLSGFCRECAQVGVEL